MENIATLAKEHKEAFRNVNSLWQKHNEMQDAVNVASYENGYNSPKCVELRNRRLQLYSEWQDAAEIEQTLATKLTELGYKFPNRDF